MSLSIIQAGLTESGITPPIKQQYYEKMVLDLILHASVSNKIRKGMKFDVYAKNS